MAPLYGWCEEEIPRDLDQTPIYLRYINADTIKVLANITHYNEQRRSELLKLGVSGAVAASTGSPL